MRSLHRLGWRASRSPRRPTLVEVSLGSLPNQRTFTVRVRPAAVDLDAIARLDDLVQDVLDGRLVPSEALRALAESSPTPLERPWPCARAYAIAALR